MLPVVAKALAEVCFVHFSSAGAGTVGSIIKVAPDIFLLLASVGAKFRGRSVPAEGPDLDDVGLLRRRGAPFLPTDDVLYVKF